MTQKSASGQGTQSNFIKNARQSWTEAFRKRSADEFEKAVAQNVTLEASVLLHPVQGIEQVKTVMGSASQMYEELVFTQEATNGPRTYLEWEGRAVGTQLFGITVLSKNDEGEIVDIAIHHRPMNGAIKFSAELGKRLRGKVDASHFFAEETPLSKLE